MTVVDTNDDTRRLYQLAQAGLLDVRKLPFLKRALSKSATQLSQKERSTMIDVFNHLLDTVLGNQQTFQKVKVGLKENRDPVGPEVKQDGNISSKFGQKWTQSKDPPPIILMKRRSIRQFPDGNRVALYYAPILNKFVSIPYGEAGMTSESVNEALLGGKKYLGKSNPNTRNKIKGLEKKVVSHHNQKFSAGLQGNKKLAYRHGQAHNAAVDLRSRLKDENRNKRAMKEEKLVWNHDGKGYSRKSKPTTAKKIVYLKHPNGGYYTKKKKTVKEESVNIQELSKKTLGSYVRKATGKGQLAMYDAGSKQREGKDNSKELRYGDKRYLGISKAVKKLSEGNIGRLDSMITEGLSSVDLVFGNDTFTFNNPGLAKQIVGLYESLENPTNQKLLDTLVNASEKDFNDAAAFAESMDIQELSKKTLGSYVKKASHDVATNSAATGRHAERSNKADDKNKKEFDYNTYAQGKKDSDVADKAFKKSWKRRTGIAKAVDKLSEGKYGNMGSFSKGAPWKETGRDQESDGPRDEMGAMSRGDEQYRKDESKKKKDASSAKRKEQPYLPFGKNGLKFGKKKMTEGSDPGWNHIKSYLDWTPKKKKPIKRKPMVKEATLGGLKYKGKDNPNKSDKAPAHLLHKSLDHAIDGEETKNNPKKAKGHDKASAAAAALFRKKMDSIGKK